MKNPVAKFAHKYNRSKVVPDKKKADKRNQPWRNKDAW